MKTSEFFRKVILRSLISTIIGIVIWHNFSFKGRILSWEEIPMAAFIMFIFNFLGWGWIYLKEHL